MADNTVINSGSGGDTIGTDDIGGIKYPRSKIIVGADGTNDGDVCLTNPMPTGGNVAHDDVDSGKPHKIGGHARSSAPTAVGNNDRVDAYFDLNGRLVVLIDSAIPAGTNNIGDVDVLSLPAGVIAGMSSLPAGANTIGAVTVASLPTSTNTLEVVGDAAHGAAVAGNPVLLGAEVHTADDTPQTNGTVHRLITDSLGKLVTRLHCNPENIVTGHTAGTAIADTAERTLIAAPGASTRLYITAIHAFNNDASVSTVVNFLDGSGGTQIDSMNLIAVSGACSHTFDPPLRLSANTAFIAQAETTSAQIEITVTGYKAVN